MSKVAEEILDLLPDGAFLVDEKSIFYPGPHYLLTIICFDELVSLCLRRGEKFLKQDHVIGGIDNPEEIANIVLDKYGDLLRETSAEMDAIVKGVKQWQVRLNHLSSVLGGD